MLSRKELTVIRKTAREQYKDKILKHIDRRIRNWEKIAGINRNDDPDCVILELTVLKTHLEKMLKKKDVFFH